MFRSFEEIEEFVLRNRRTRVRIALAAAQDEPALSALVEAQRKGIARGQYFIFMFDLVLPVRLDPLGQVHLMAIAQVEQGPRRNGQHQLAL